MFNFVGIQGRLGQDAETRTTGNGRTFTRFSVASVETYVKDGERNEIVTWVNCVIWGDRFQGLMKYLTKGQQVVVEGSLQSSEWTTDSGEKRSSLNVSVNRIHPIWERNNNNEGQQRQGSRYEDIEEDDMYEDDQGEPWDND